MKFFGPPLAIPQAQADDHAVQRIYVDNQDIVLAARITALENAPSGDATALSVVNVIDDYTANAGEFVVADASLNDIIVELPNNPPANTVVAIKKSDSSINTVTIQPTGGALIDGDFGAVFTAPGSGAELIYSGSDWYVESVVFFDSSVTVLTFRGEYNAATAYNSNDVISYQGGGYVAKAATTGTAPTPGASNANWALLVAKGDKGDTGDTGLTGAVGATGATPVFTIGTVTQGATAAASVNTTDPANPILSLTLPAPKTGVQSVTFDGSGIGTIIHDLGVVPSVFLVQPELGSVPLYYAPYNRAGWTTTTATFRAWTTAGAAASGTLTRVYWLVS